MLEDLRKKQKIVIYFIAFVFIVGMGIMGLTDIFFNKKPVFGSVDGTKITYEMFNEELQKSILNYRQNNPEAEMSQDLIRQLSDQTWQRLTYRIVMSKQLKKFGVKITDDDILKEMQDNPPQELLQNPDLQTNGRFDKKKYLTALKQSTEFFTALEDYYRESLPYKRLMEKVKEKANINLDSLKAEYIKEHDEMFGKLIVFDYNKLPRKEVTDAEIKAYYDKNKETDKEINKGKSTSMKFILFEIKPSESDFEVTRRDIEDIYNMVQRGEDFGQLAKDYSEDPGSAAQMGSLGVFGKGQMVPEFEDMAFSLQPGEVSKPFKTQFGWHILRTEGFSTTADGQPQVAASHILKKVNASLDTIDEFEDKAKAAAKLIKKVGIDNAAKELKLEPVDTDAIYADTDFIPGLGKHDELLKFARKRGNGAVSKVEKDRRGNFIVAQITNKTKDPYVPLEKVKMRIKYDLERQKKIADMVSIAQNFVKTHKPEEFLVAAEKDTLIKIVELQNFKSNTSIAGVGTVPDVNTKALAMDSGEISSLLETDKGQFIIVSERRVKADMQAFIKDTDEQNKLKTRMEEQAWNRWYDATMKKAKIIDNRQEYNLY
jgi:peptidyl-prolyl cis-trans isomerase D